MKPKIFNYQQYSDTAQDLIIAQAEVTQLKEENSRLRRGLNEAVKDISAVIYHERKMPCFVCQYKDAFGTEMHKYCGVCNPFNSRFKWRGEKGAER